MWPYYQVTVSVRVAVGLLRWGLDMQINEVRSELARRGIPLSKGQISMLCDEFLVRFRLWFEASREAWAEGLQRGLVLLIDGTSKDGGPVTYRAVAYKQGVTVHAACIESENEADITAFLRRVKDAVGVPRLILRDGAQAVTNACDGVFPGVAQRLCHWHWLKNAGKALLDEASHELRQAVVDTGQLAGLQTVQGTLAKAQGKAMDARRRGLLVWARLLIEHVVSARDSTGGRPFCLAYHEVMRRVHQARGLAKRAVGVAVAWNVCEPLVLEAKERLDALSLDEAVKPAFVRVDRRFRWFGMLRSWLGLEDAETGRAEEPEGEAISEDEVAHRIVGLRKQARAVGPEQAEAWECVVRRFRKHRDELFPQVRLRDPPRTTGLIETLQREDQRGCRRRTGTVRVRGMMERVGEHLAVFSNVENAWFVEHALEGVDLVGAFMRQDRERVKAGMQALRSKRFGDRLPVAGKDRGPLLEEFLALTVEPKAVSEKALGAWADKVEGVA